MRSRPRNRSNGVQLSPRQVQAVRLAADGLSDVAAAAVMGVAVTTYRTHLLQARWRLGAVNRKVAAVLAWRAGLIPRPEEKILRGGLRRLRA